LPTLPPVVTPLFLHEQNNVLKTVPKSNATNQLQTSAIGFSFHNASGRKFYAPKIYMAMKNNNK